jgi:hypothetical protein
MCLSPSWRQKDTYVPTNVGMTYVRTYVWFVCRVKGITIVKKSKNIFFLFNTKMFCGIRKLSIKMLWDLHFSCKRIPKLQNFLFANTFCTFKYSSVFRLHHSPGRKMHFLIWFFRYFWLSEIGIFCKVVFLSPEPLKWLAQFLAGIDSTLCIVYRELILCIVFRELILCIVFRELILCIVFRELILCIFFGN